MHINTIGQIIKSGDIIAKIILDNHIIEVEARINQKDIAHIKIGQKPLMLLSIFNFSIYDGIEAKVKKY